VTKLLCSAPGRASAELVGLAAGLRSGATVTHSEGDWIGISGPGADKESALARISRRLGVAAAHVVGIGDQLNDLGMLGWAGTAVAVANAIPAVLELADVVVPSNADEGVARFMAELAGRVRPD
jgi:hydroxymethylpyrimidine pyrophosphatase-like HAD family hydrolase